MLTPSCTYTFGTLNVCNPQRVHHNVDAFIEGFRDTQAITDHLSSRGSLLLQLADCPNRYRAIAKDIKRKSIDILFLQELMPIPNKLKLKYNYNASVLINPSLSEKCRQAQAKFDAVTHGSATTLIPEDYDLRISKNRSNDTVGIAFNTKRFRLLTSNTTPKGTGTPKKHQSLFHHILTLKDVKTEVVLSVASCHIKDVADKGRQQLAAVIETVESNLKADLYVIGGDFNADFTPGTPPDPKLSQLLTAGYIQDESAIPTEFMHGPSVSDTVFVKVNPKGKLATIQRTALEHLFPKSGGALLPSYSDHFLSLTRVKVDSKEALIPVPDFQSELAPPRSLLLTDTDVIPSPLSTPMVFEPPSFHLDPAVSTTHISDAPKQPNQADLCNIFKTKTPHTTPIAMPSPHLFFTSAQTPVSTPVEVVVAPPQLTPIPTTPVTPFIVTPLVETPLQPLGRKIENKTGCMSKIWNKIKAAITAIFACLARCFKCFKSKKTDQTNNDNITLPIADPKPRIG